MNNRIDRIDGNKYYEYTKIKNLNVSDADEKFSLDYKQNELSPEAKDKKDTKDDKKVSEQEMGGAAKQNGVRLEISQNGRLAATDKHRQTAQAKKVFGAGMSPAALLESVKEFVTGAVAAVKDFFYKIWNDPQPEDSSAAVRTDENELFQQTGSNAVQTIQDTDASEPDASEESGQDTAASYRMKEAKLDKEIQPYLRNGDLEQVISLLTDNGRRASARNSTLLTYYDRNGRMIEPNASDRERILYGDRNTRKL